MKPYYTLEMSDESIRYYLDPENNRNTIIKLKTKERDNILTFTSIGGNLMLPVANVVVKEGSVFYAFYEFVFRTECAKTVEFVQDNLHFRVPFTDLINLVEMRDKENTMSKKMYIRRMDLMRFVVKKFK